MEARSNEESRSNEAQPNTPPIAVQGLRKSFGPQKVLNGISLSIAPHEIVTVLGRSGTGKSVLLKLLIGLEKPDAGSISSFNVQFRTARSGGDAKWGGSFARRDDSCHWVNAIIGN